MMFRRQHTRTCSGHCQSDRQITHTRTRPPKTENVRNKRGYKDRPCVPRIPAPSLLEIQKTSTRPRGRAANIVWQYVHVQLWCDWVQVEHNRQAVRTNCYAFTMGSPTNRCTFDAAKFERLLVEEFLS